MLTSKATHNVRPQGIEVDSGEALVDQICSTFPRLLPGRQARAKPLCSKVTSVHPSSRAALKYTLPPIDPFQALRSTCKTNFLRTVAAVQRKVGRARRRDGQAILSPKVTMWCRPALRLLSCQVAPHSWETPWPSWLLSRP